MSTQTTALAALSAEHAREAAGTAHTHAQRKSAAAAIIAYMHATGTGVQPDWTAAKLWCERSASLHVESHAMLVSLAHHAHSTTLETFCDHASKQSKQRDRGETRACDDDGTDDQLDPALLDEVQVWDHDHDALDFDAVEVWEHRDCDDDCDELLTSEPRCAGPARETHPPDRSATHDESKTAPIRQVAQQRNTHLLDDAEPAAPAEYTLNAKRGKKKRTPPSSSTETAQAPRWA